MTVGAADLLRDNVTRGRVIDATARVVARADPGTTAMVGAGRVPVVASMTGVVKARVRAVGARSAVADPPAIGIGAMRGRGV
ncbi:hypothetical protein [Nocardia heshunensis]